jgi:PAS domain S-box-containing protein
VHVHEPRPREVLGYEPGELVGRMPFDYMTPDEGKRVMDLFRPLPDTHKPFELVDYYVFRKDGSKVFFKTNAMPIFDDSGRFRGYRGVNRDIANGRR